MIEQFNFPYHATIIATVGIWLLGGLATLWIGSRRWHWFVQVMLLIGLSLPMYAIEAPDLAIMLLACHLVIYFPVRFTAIRRRKKEIYNLLPENNREEPERKSFWQPVVSVNWSLTDMLLATVVMAIIVFMLNQELPRADFLNVEGQTSLNMALRGSLIGGSLLIAIGLSLGKIDWKIRWAFDITFVFYVLLIILHNLMRLLNTTTTPSLNIDAFVSPSDDEMFLRPVIFFLMFFILHNYRILFVSPVPDTKVVKLISRPYGFVIGSVSALILGLIIMSTGYIYVRLLESYPQKTINPSYSDEENGYLDFVAAGKEMEASNIFNQNIEMLPGNTTRQEIDLYQSQFDKIEHAFHRKFLTAFIWEKKADYIFGGTMYIQEMRSVARALHVKSRQERHDGNGDQAMQDAMLCVRLQIPLMKSGIQVDAIVGCAVEGIGSIAVHDSIALASDEKLKQAINTLLQLDSQEKTGKSICESDHQISWSRFSWLGRLYHMQSESNNTNDSSKKMQNVIDRLKAIRRLLITEMALELHHRKTGQYPATLASLVPEYLDAVPIDPYSEKRQAIQYAVDEETDQITLYSLGPDRIDNGGELGADNFWHESGDINYSKHCQIQRKEFLSTALPDPSDEIE